MNFNELRNDLIDALSNVEAMSTLDPATSEFKTHKKTASISIEKSFLAFAPCPDNAGCDGCKCGYDGNEPEDDKDPIGGGGTNPPG